MKKLIGVLLLAVGMAMPAQAQLLKWGVKGGVNMSKPSFSKNEYKSENFTGFYIGPMVETTIPIIGLGVDGALLFSQRGIKIDENGVTETVKQNGVDIPVNLKYTFGLGSLAGIYLAAGPDFYFDFSGNKKIDGEKIDKKGAQVGINVGAGLKLLNHFQLGFNYNIPLSDTGKFEGTHTNSYKTRTWQVGVAYMF
ncbi:MAG: porin family protein [Bacteroides sp.]|nr:porin family protein [Bacteroides sp.]